VFSWVARPAVDLSANCMGCDRWPR
jgi:hypothetical protein